MLGSVFHSHQCTLRNSSYPARVRKALDHDHCTLNAQPTPSSINYIYTDECQSEMAPAHVSERLHVIGYFRLIVCLELHLSYCAACRHGERYPHSSYPSRSIDKLEGNFVMQNVSTPLFSKIFLLRLF